MSGNLMPWTWLPCLYDRHSQVVWLGQIPSQERDQAIDRAKEAGRLIAPGTRRDLGLTPGAVDTGDAGKVLGRMAAARRSGGRR